MVTALPPCLPALSGGPCGRSEALVVTVGDSVVEVEAALAAGRIGCPRCPGVLAGWGWARARVVRGMAGPISLRPRRGRCSDCGATHVLLPVSVLARRADAAEVIGDRTLQRHLAKAGLSGAVPAPPTTVFGRFEAEKPNDLWTGDACHGPMVAGRKAILFAFIDDHSRMIVGARWGYAEDTVRLAAALRPALAARGIPESIYVDNGSAFIDSWLLRGCARLGVKLTHSTPGRPQGRGKIERLFGTVREEFLVEVTGTGQDGRRQVESLTELNRLFTVWSEVIYARRVHTEAGQAPAERYAGVIPRFAHPDALAEAFRWSQQRKVTKVRTVSMFNNVYQVEPYLVGRTVDLVFDPFDLTHIDVVCDGLPAETTAPLVIGRHSHPRARSEEPDVIAPATGIDYLGLIDATHNGLTAGAVNYAALIGQPGQPDEPDATTPQAVGTRITDHDDEPVDLADTVSEVEIR